MWHKNILARLAHFQVQHPVLTVLLIFSLLIVMLGGASQVETVASLEQMMPKQVEEINAFNVLRDNYLGQDMVAIVLEVDRESSDEDGVFDITDPRVIDYLHQLSSLLKDEPDIRDVYSLANIIPASSTPDQIKDYVQTSSGMRFINDDKTITTLIATSDIGADDQRTKLLARAIQKHVQSVGHPSGVTIRLTGTPLIQQRLGELIAHDRTSTQWISTLLVFIITVLIFGTITSALVPIITVTVSVTFLYGTMGYANLPISTLAGGVAAMVIGIGIDFAIHIINKFKFERKKGYSISQSIECAVVQTGSALSATALTTTGAFLAFLIGSMPEMGRFGILMAIGITFSLVFSLFGLPALLVLEEKIIYRYKQKFKFGVEGEFHLEDSR